MNEDALYQKDIETLKQHYEQMLEKQESEIHLLTKQKEALQTTIISLKKTVKEALAVNKAKSVFLANVSHELRTPLNAIIGYSELVEEDLEEIGITSLKSDLQHIRSSANHLMLIISDLLDLSRIESGETEIDIQFFSLKQVIEQVGTTITPMMKINKNSLMIMVDDNIPTMRTDLCKVQQIIYNLLSNATKFTHSGAVSISASFIKYKNNPAALISVRDTGSGIKPEILDRIFEPFFQAPNAISAQKNSGTGLGLTICMRFTRLLGGKLTVKSKQDTGTIFTATIPVEYIENNF